MEAELRRVLCPQHWTLGVVFLARGINRKMGMYNQQVADEYVATVPGRGGGGVGGAGDKPNP